MAETFHTTAAGTKLRYAHQPGSTPGILFCGGFRSDLHSTKAGLLAEWCAERGIQFTRFDYFAHGKSDGIFTDFIIGQAITDTVEMLDHHAIGPQIIVGSSMGAWIGLAAARERRVQVRGFIGIASAPDFSERLMFAKMTPEQRTTLNDTGELWIPGGFGEDYPITRIFVEEARHHLLLDDVIGLDIPMHLIHGQQDVSVPWETTMLLAKQVISEDVTVTLVKDGDHRLNRPQDMAIVTAALTRLLDAY